MSEGEVGEAARERMDFGLKRKPLESGRVGWVPYPQEDGGSFPGVLTTEEVSTQAKGSVQSELQVGFLETQRDTGGKPNLEKENMCPWS